MMLTKKAKEDFNKWLESDKDILCGLDLFQLNQTCINALIIEWFDSVGLVILPFSRKVINNKNFSAEIYINGETICFINEWFKTRQEAKEEAIKKANEIYNKN